MLALALVGLAGGLGWFVWGTGTVDRHAVADGEVALWDLRRPDIVRVLWGSDGGRCEIVRAGEAWSSGGAPVSVAQVNDLLDALDEGRRGVEVGPIDAAASGLDQPVRVEVHDAGDRVVTVEVGADAPVGGRTYVRRADGRVLAVRGGLGAAVRAGCPR